MQDDFILKIYLTMNLKLLLDIIKKLKKGICSLDKKYKKYFIGNNTLMEKLKSKESHMHYRRINENIFQRRNSSEYDCM